MNTFTDKLQAIKTQNNDYKKSHKTFDEQLVLLKSRNLLVSNDDYALMKLQHINYYRLSAYFLPLQHKKDSPEANNFLDDTRFEDVIGLYYFDFQLRKLIFEAMEGIEIYFRTQIAYHHSQAFGPFGYLKHENLTCDADFFDRVQNSIREEKDRSTETFIAHFKEKYNTTDLPIWAIVEVISMSTLSKLYTMMPTKEQQAVIKPLKGITKDVFHSWFHALTVVRNICAHHSRLWNKTLGVKFEVPKKLPVFRAISTVDDKGNPLYMNDKVFFALSVIEYILNAIGEELDFKNKVKRLIASHPTIDINVMGFPPDWETLEIWSE